MSSFFSPPPSPPQVDQNNTLMVAAVVVLLLGVGAFVLMKPKKGNGTPAVATRASSRLAAKTPVRAAASPAPERTPKSALKRAKSPKPQSSTKTPKNKKTFLADVNGDGEAPWPRTLAVCPPPSDMLHPVSH